MKKQVRRNVVSFFSRGGIAFLLIIMRFFPLKVFPVLGGGLGNICYCLAGKNRELALHNLRLAFNRTRPAARLRMIARESFRTMGSTLFDTIRFRCLPREQARRAVAVRGLENLTGALRKGKGVIAVSAHLSAFTLLGYRLLIDGYRVSYVARRLRDQKLERMFTRFCAAAGQSIIFNSPLPAFYRSCLHVLSRNEIIIAELDQNFDSRGVPVNFFGRKAMIASGPLGLAQRSGAAVVPMFIIAGGAPRYTVYIEKPIELDSAAGEKENHAEYFQQLIDVIERYIREYPGQWMSWVHKQW